MGLREYFKKRAFGKTPEPKGKLEKSAKQTHKPLRFVIHKHHASQLHYDLRLECDGVLKSWAVPKGPSLNPHDKHLAVRVEDHPLEYRKFEGVIPEDNYGAGEVIIWDEGTFVPRHESNDPEATMRRKLKSGKFAFVLSGKKLHGEFALVRMHGDDKTWLLIKKSDEFVDRRHDITKEDESVKSGKTVEELAQNPDITELPKQKMPTKISPMLCTLVDEPFDKPGWLFEIKWDGFRAIATKKGTSVQLSSRNGIDFQKRFPEVFQTLHKINDDVVLDGEIVCVDSEGKAHFEWLQNWGRTPEPQGHLLYYVFDILWLNGHDTCQLPLIERKKLLANLLPANSPLRLSDHVADKGVALFKKVRKENLEGIVAKEAQSPYLQGARTMHWQKIKTHQRQEVVIGGYTDGQGTRKHIGALLVGVYKKGELQFIGHVNAGMPEAERLQLWQTLRKISVKTPPFKIEPKTNTTAHWIKPILVGEVEFTEWTSDGSLRHPEFKGLRPDKDPKKVRREQAARVTPLATKTVATTAHSATIQPLLTHLDKMFWPEAKITKGDLIAYYETVGMTMLPYLHDRPHSLNRQPGGYKDRGFYQKDTSSLHLPKFTSTTTIRADSTHQKVQYLVCQNVDTLLYMAQLGCIEINPWNSRTAHLDKPDWAVIDLDPEGRTFKEVVTVAQAVHQVCEEWGIAHYPKTSGKTGIHIFIPAGGKYTYQQVRDFAHLIVIEVNKRQPKITSLERSPAKRRNRIYLDYLQNSEGQTLAAPYSVRPTKKANVSTPLHWDEVNAQLLPEQFTIKNMLARLQQVGDIWQPVIGTPVDIADILEKLS